MWQGLDILITTYLYDVLLLVIAMIGVVRYRTLTIPFRILTLSAISTFLLILLEEVFIGRYHNNAPIYHIEAIAGYTFNALIYYHFFTSKWVKRFVVLTLVILIPFSVVNAFFLQPFYNKVFPTYVNMPTLGLLVILSLLLFKQMLLSPSKTPLLSQGIFWFNTAILFYSTTKFLNIGLSNAYRANVTLNYVVFYLWYFTDYIFAILQGFALFTASKENRKDAF